MYLYLKGTMLKCLHLQVMLQVMLPHYHYL